MSPDAPNPNERAPRRIDKMNTSQYAWNPDDYSAHSQAQYQWTREIIEKTGLEGTESVLDIGCGDGKVTAMLASYLPFGEVTGIDSSAGMIALAQEKFPPSDYPRLSFQRMDAMNILFENRFDLAFSNAALHWVSNHTRVLSGVFRSLKEGGRLFFQMGGMGNARDIMDIADAMIHSSPWKQYFKGFVSPYTFLSAEEYRVLLERAGFTRIRDELIPKDMAQDGKEGLSGWIRTTWLPYTERIPEHMRDRFISDMAGAYMKEYPPDSGGQVHVKMIRLEVKARKP